LLKFFLEFSFLGLLLPQTIKKPILMKKIFVAVAVVALFASCKKDYTCTCTTAGVSASIDYTGLSKSEADDQEKACTTTSICVWAEK